MTTRRAIDFYDGKSLAQCGRPDLQEEAAEVARWLSRLPAELKERSIVEFGCGRGALRHISPKHLGLDLSLRALVSGEQFRCAVADMESVPLQDDSAGLVFSWAAIEHVPHPESVLSEITRVLAPGGIAVLKPAWHCRPWAAEGLEFRPYSELRPMQKVRKSLIPLRNSLPWRAPGELVRRTRREFQLSRGGPLPLEYETLVPNLETYVGTDSDAFTSLDPHAFLVWFLSRGWKALSHPTRSARLRATHQAIAVQKPGLV